MHRIAFTILLLLALASAACSSEPDTPQPVTPQPVAPTETTYPAPQVIEGQQPVEPYPGPTAIQTPVEGYPGPENPGGQPPAYTPGEPTGYEPQPEDGQLGRGQVFLQLENSQLLVLESYPVQAVLVLHGDLPDPCHKLRVVVSPPDSANTVQVEVYSVRNPEDICIQILEPFEARIGLGSFAGAEFRVIVNGTQVGTISG